MFCISAIVKGFVWTAAVEPAMQMLGLGSIFMAWNIAKNPNLYDDHILRSESKLTEEKNDIEKSMAVKDEQKVVKDEQKAVKDEQIAIKGEEKAVKGEEKAVKGEEKAVKDE